MEQFKGSSSLLFRLAVQARMLRVLPSRVGGPGPIELADMVILLTAGVVEVLDLILGLAAAVVGRAPNMAVQGLRLVLVSFVAECIRDRDIC